MQDAGPRDPREREEWFVRLPREQRRAYRERWRAELNRFDSYDAWQRKQSRLAVAQGAGILMLAQLFMGGGGGALLTAALCGAALGKFWAVAEGGRLLRSSTMAATFLILQAVTGGWTATDPGSFVFGAFSMMLAAALANATGVLFETRSHDSDAAQNDTTYRPVDWHDLRLKKSIAAVEDTPTVPVGGSIAPAIEAPKPAVADATVAIRSVEPPQNPPVARR